MGTEVEGGTGANFGGGGASSDVPRWIRTATAFVGLVGAVGTICFGAWELRQKADADERTAVTNLDIAKKQADASLAVAERQAKANLDVAYAQIKAHQQEYEFQGKEHDQEERTNELQRLAGVINDLLNDKPSSEGQLDILSSYVKSDHRYDEVIANAIKASLNNPQSESEINLAFILLQRLDVPKAQFLIDVNKNAKVLFDTALLDDFWTRLASRTSATTTDFSVTSKSRDEGGLSPAHLLFHLVSDTERDVVEPSMTGAEFIAPVSFTYESATINLHFNLIMGPDMDPKAEESHQKDLDGEWWRAIRGRLLLRAKGPTADYGKTQRLAANLIERTSALLPAALQNEMHRPQRGVFRLSGCHLSAKEDWPEGRYPSISFYGAYISPTERMKMGNARFTQGTKDTLLRGLVPLQTGGARFSRWVSSGDIDSSYQEHLDHLVFWEFSKE